MSGASLAIAVFVCFGLGLRLMAARGDLWLDELWSLDLVSHVTSPDQVFWNISHDNNHFLNSLWMFVVGQHAAPVVYRLPSVVFSTLAILVAARIGSRVNAAAAVAGAALASCSYAFVDYGSEARGYAGLILAILVAVDLSRSTLDRMVAAAAGSSTGEAVTLPLELRAIPSNWALAATILFGACAHLTMFVEAAVLGFAALLRLYLAGWSFRRALDGVITLFRPAILVLLLLLAVIGLGVRQHGGFTVGGFTPFTAEHYGLGYGGLLGSLLGLPWWTPSFVVLAVTGLVIAGAMTVRLLDRRWLTLAATALLVWPGTVFLLRVPNTEYPRYFLTAGLLLPIFLAEIAGRMWSRGGFVRVIAAGLVVAVCAGQAPDLAELVVHHRGSPASAVALMAREGPTTFRSRNSWMTDSVVKVYADQSGSRVTPEDKADRCRSPADWVVYDADHDEAVPDAPVLSAPGCSIRYRKVADFPAARWSGRSWTLYRRSP